jgi:hypothetical protein
MSEAAPLLVWAIFPLVDLKPLTMPAVDRVSKPWLAVSQRHFLRCFGAQKLRRPTTTPQTELGRYTRASESWYFSARRFARLADPPIKSASQPTAVISQPIAGRLYADGIISARLEFVFRVVRDGKSLEQCLRELTTVTMLLPMRNDGGLLLQASPRCPLNDIIGTLREKFTVASVRKGPRQQIIAALAAGGPDRKQALALVRDTDPLLIVHGGTKAGQPLYWGRDITAGNSCFRTLLVEPMLDPARDNSLRRAFVRLYCLEAALGYAQEVLAAPTTGLPPGDWLMAMNRLVQQTEDAALNLRRVSSTGIVALQELADRFAMTAQSLGENLNIRHADNAAIQTLAARLLRAGPTWKAEAVAAKLRLPRVDGLLLASQIDAMQTIIVETGLAALMRALVQGIDAKTLANVPTAMTDADTSWNHLMYLNGLAKPDDLSVLLANLAQLLNDRWQGGRAGTVYALLDSLHRPEVR